jgi:hypothetical protein
VGWEEAFRVVDRACSMSLVLMGEEAGVFESGREAWARVHRSCLRLVD